MILPLRFSVPTWPDRDRIVQCHPPLILRIALRHPYKENILFIYYM